MITLQTHKDAQPPGTPPQLAAVPVPWEHLPLPTLVTVRPTGPVISLKPQVLGGAAALARPWRPARYALSWGSTARVAGDRRKRAPTKERVPTRVQRKVPRRVQRGSRAPGLPGTPSPALLAGSSGWVRAERVGRAVGEEPPEPVLDARLDARLELMLGARG